MTHMLQSPKWLAFVFYFKRISKTSLYIGLYVDDFIYASLPAINKWFAQAMAKRFSIKELGPIKHVLGIQVQQTTSGITITQSAYITRTLKDMDLLTCHPSHLPATGGDITAATKCAGNNHYYSTNYKHIIEKMMYAAVGTRPDIIFATNFLARYAHEPTVHHLHMAKTLLRYLSATSDHSLHYPATNGQFKITAYSDADWAGAYDSRSTSGILTIVNETVLTWYSKKQSTVAMSTAEAEYISAAECELEIV